MFVPKGITDASVGGTGLRKTVNGLTFFSDFDSANLKDVRGPNNRGEYELFVACDCEGGAHQTR